MAYDEDVADRVREQLADEDAITEKKMFGGLAFMLAGNMAVGISNRSELMVRVGPDGADDALERPHAHQMDMNGRPMTGFIAVSGEGFESDGDLADWVRRGVGYARTLPAKG